MLSISGANRSVYAPEPYDVGRVIQADILSNGHKFTVTTDGPINAGWCYKNTHAYYNGVINKNIMANF